MSSFIPSVPINVNYPKSGNIGNSGLRRSLPPMIKPYSVGNAGNPGNPTIIRSVLPPLKLNSHSVGNAGVPGNLPNVISRTYDLIQNTTSIKTNFELNINDSNISSIMMENIGHNIKISLRKNKPLQFDPFRTNNNSNPIRKVVPANSVNPIQNLENGLIPQYFVKLQIKSMKTEQILFERNNFEFSLNIMNMDEFKFVKEIDYIQFNHLFFDNPTNVMRTPLQRYKNLCRKIKSMEGIFKFNLYLRKTGYTGHFFKDALIKIDNRRNIFLHELLDVLKEMNDNMISFIDIRNVTIEI